MKTTKYYFHVNSRDICYIRTTIESYDGMAQVETMDPSIGRICIYTAPGCEDSVLGLLDSFQKEEGLDIKMEMSADIP
ncbi:MAG: DUF4911 domain-containing protein [Desulfatiglans sp.]|jgi:hypothetical protein|nr:DUF4911 domain-containing protein [Thermodesulfobacteriota bacterium]MEE4352107.1 DUF4911 domain-containing protein [Desulfatiglans sp.]